MEDVATVPGSRAESTEVLLSACPIVTAMDTAICAARFEYPQLCNLNSGQNLAVREQSIFVCRSRCVGSQAMTRSDGAGAAGAGREYHRKAGTLRRPLLGLSSRHTDFPVLERVKEYILKCSFE